MNDERPIPLKALAVFGMAGCLLWPVPGLTAAEWLVRAAGALVLVVLFGLCEARRRDQAQRARDAEREILDSVPTYIWRVDASGAATFFNRPWFEMTGLPPDDALGDGWHDALHPDERDEVLTTWREAFERREPLVHECRIRQTDGAYRWHVVRGRPLHVPDGTFDGYVGSSIDIEDGRKAERDAERSRQRLMSFRDQMRDGFVFYEFDPPITDDLGRQETIDALFRARAVDGNVAAARLVGCADVDALCGSEFRELVDASDPAVTALVETYIDGGFAVENYVLRQGDRWLQVNGSAIAEYGVRFGAWVTYRDITDREETLADLERTRYAVDNAGEAIILVDMHGRFLYGNRAARAMYGYSPEAFSGLSIDDVDAEMTAERFRAMWPGARATDASAQFDSYGLRSDGMTFPIEVTMDVLSHEGDGFAYAFIRDITNQRQRNRALRITEHALQQALDAILITAGHEGHVTYANKSACELFGYSPDAIVGRTITDLDAADDPGRFRRLWKMLLSGQALERFESEALCADGHRVPVEIAFDLMWFEDEPSGIIALRDISARRQVEDTRSRFSAFVEQTQDAILRYEYPEPLPPDLDVALALERQLDAVITDCNDSAARLYGFPDIESLLGKRWRDIGEGSTSATGYSHEQFVRNGYQLQGYESPYRRADGASGWVRIYARAQMTAGRFAGVWATVRDITAEKQAEDALLDSERRRAEFLARTREAVVYYRYEPPVPMDCGREEQIERLSHAIIGECNHAAATLYGFPSPDAMLGLRYSDIVDTDEPANAAIIEAFIGAGFRLDQYETDFPLAHTHRKWMSFDAVGVVEDGVCRGVWVGSRDISARKIAEHRLRIASQRLNSHIENSPVAVVEWAVDFRIIRWSPRAERLFGWTEDEVVGQRLEDLRLVHPSDVPDANRRINRLIRGETDSYIHRNRILTKSGDVLHCEIYVSALRFDGRLESTLALVNDVTEQELTRAELDRHRNKLEALVEQRTAELEAAQAELVRKEKLSMLGRLTGTVSHELRNPLGTIKSSLYVLKRSLSVTTPAVERALTRAERNISRCDKIIDELLDYTRLQDLKLEPVAIDDWLRDVLGDYELPANVELQTNLSFGGELCIEPDRLRRCVINLLSNACEAMTDRGATTRGRPVVRVSSRPNDGWLEIEIADNGPGIPAVDREKVLEPLYSTKGFGVGLGLPIVKQIVDQHDGTLDIQSGVGTGTTVRLFLPLRDDTMNHGTDAA